MALFSPPISASNLPAVNMGSFLAYSRVFYEARRYTNSGPVVSMLEQRLADFHKVDHCIAVSSGFWGLALAARALTEGSPDRGLRSHTSRRRVVMPSLTYRRMADAMWWAGLVPRFCEVDERSLAISADSARPFMDGDVALLLGVHPMVGCCDVVGLEKLAADAGVPLLIDSVESPYEVVPGTGQLGRRTGTFGSAEVFSLHASKLVSAMEGGYITTNDPDLAERLALARAFGFDVPDNVRCLGANAKMNEIHAAYAMACLDHLEEQIPHHLANYEAYRSGLSVVDGLRVVAYDNATRPSYRQIVVEILATWPLTRAQTLEALHAEGALARPYYSPALHQKPAGYPRDVKPLPVTEALSERFILMPSGGRVTVEDVRRLCELLAAVAAKARASSPRPGAPQDRSTADRALNSHHGAGRPIARAPLDLAAKDNSLAFDRPLPVGQLWFPEWGEYEARMRGIVERGWYTNHGPLAELAEERLSEFYGVRNAIVFTNATVGIMALAVALGLRGPVIVPSFTFAATAQALTWAGLDVVFCDVDESTHQVTDETVSACLDSCRERARPDAVLAVNLWGGACDVDGLEALCYREGLHLVFDSAHASGTVLGGRRLGGRGKAEVFSFHATKILSATEGGAVCTDDDELAERLRNVRSSYGTRRAVPVPTTLNGRFSEAQAAILLHSLADFDRRVAHNKEVIQGYKSALADVEGIKVVEPTAGVVSNYSYAVLDVGPYYPLSRDGLLKALRSENVLARRYFYPGVHRTPPYLGRNYGDLTTTTKLCERVLQLPVGALVAKGAAEHVAAIVAAAGRHAPAMARS